MKITTVTIIFLFFLRLDVCSQAFENSIEDPFGLTDIGSRSTPTFVDIDNDGDYDLFSGESNGSFYFFENIGTQSIANYSSSTENPFGLTDIGSRSSPTFVDIDNDGDYDLFSGETNGSFYFYENIGIPSNPSFSASIENPYGLTSEGSSSVPFFVDIDYDGDYDIFSGESYGSYNFFENIGTQSNPSYSASIENPFGLTDIGSRSNPTFADIDNDGDYDLFSGESYGNFYFFKNDYYSGINETLSFLPLIYPNPTNDIINIQIAENIEKIVIFDVNGEKITETKSINIDLSEQKKGLYLVKIITGNRILTKKVMLR